jgi:hypothetical protein
MVSRLNRFVWKSIGFTNDNNESATEKDIAGLLAQFLDSVKDAPSKTGIEHYN